MLIFGLFLLGGIGSVWAQSNRTVTFTGNISDFNVAERFAAAANNTTYAITFDATYMYFGAFRTSGTFGSGDNFAIYIDTDPRNTLASGNGTTSGRAYNSFTPTLPFNADYTSYTEQSYTDQINRFNATWASTGVTPTVFTNSTCREVRIALKDLGNPASVYVTLWMGYSGGIFSNAPGTSNEGTAATRTMTGFFGSFPVYKSGITPIAFRAQNTTAANGGGTPISNLTVTPTASITAGDYGDITINNTAGISSLSGNTSFSGTFTIGSGTTGATRLGLGGFILTVGGRGIGGTAGQLNVNGSSGAPITASAGGGITFLGNGLFVGNNSQTSLILIPANATVSIGGAVDLGLVGGATLKSGIAGTLQINPNGSILTNAPQYTTGSTLKYNTGGTYGRNLEWNASGVGTLGTTAGYPNNVQISSNTTLDLGANSGTATARACAGNLTIDDGSSLNMALNPMTQPLTVGGNLTLGSAGIANLTLSTSVGGDLALKGNWVRNGTSTFTHNNRSITFSGTGAQGITGATTFPYLIVNNTSGASTGITINSPISVSELLTLTAGVVNTTATNLLTISKTTNTAISGGSTTTFIKGPLAWNLPSAASGTYTFPIGKGTTYLPMSLNSPTTSSTTTLTAEAFAASTGGTAGTGISSLSTTEYWSLTSTAGFTSSSVSLTRQTALGTLDQIASSTSKTGTYISVGGTVSGTSINNSTASSGTTQYFVMAAKYCSPAMTSASASGDYIGNFTFAGINNTTGDAASDYTYYNLLTANVTVGQGYPVSLLAGGASTTYAQQFGIWVDYNQNGLFTDAGEFVFATTSSTYSPTTVTGTITIPALSASVLAGTTRLRVGSRYSTAVASNNSCVGGSSFGEYEDYNITIATPVTPTIVFSTNAVAAGNIAQGTTNNPIYSFAISPTVASATLTGLSITTTGSYVSTDITNLKVWYQTSAQGATFTGTGILLSTLTTPGVAGLKTFPALTNQTIANGATGYIFITADIPCATTLANTIAVNAVTGSNTTFSLGTATATLAAGNTQTVASATPLNATSAASSSLAASSSISWVNPIGCYDEIMIVAAPATNTGTPTGNGGAYTGSLTYGSGTALGNGFVVYKGATSPQTVIGLTNGTTYYFKIFTRNGTTWSSGGEVNTTPNLVYCTPSSTVATNYISGFSTTLGQTNLTNTSSNTSGGYVDYTTITPTVSQYPNNAVNFSIDIVVTGASGTAGIGIWVDWNSNGVFTDAGENVYNSNSGKPIGTTTGTFTVPNGQSAGNYRMRVLMDRDLTTPVPCSFSGNGTNYRGEAEDYIFTVLAAITPTITLATNNMAAGTIEQGSTNNPIYSFAISPAVASATLTGLSITTTGSYASADVTNLKCYYQASSTFNAGTATLLSTLTTPGAAGSKTFPSFTNQTIANGATGYIFITADIPCAATLTNTIVINAVTGANTTFSLGTAIGNPSAGNTQTVASATPLNATSAAASSLVASSAISWVNPTGCYDEIMIVAAPATNTGTPTGNASTYTGSLTYGSGTGLGNGFVVYKGATSPQTVTGLTNGTTYYFKIFTRLGSVWSNGTEVSATPSVAYCTSTGPVSQGSDYFTSFNATVGGVGITNTSTYSANGYGNFTAQSVTQAQLGTVNYSMVSPGVANGSSFGIFVDWNQNGVFTDAGESVYNSAGNVSVNPTGSFSVPVGATLGTTRMRVVVQDATATVVSCNSVQASSETEDYTFIVTAAPVPTITALSSTTLCVGGSLTITGTNLTGAVASGVTIGGTAVSSITSNTGTSMVVVVGSGSNGTVSVTTVSTATFGSVTVNPLPTATWASAATAVCQSSSAQTTTLAYSATANSPSSYSITWNASPTNSFATVTNQANTFNAGAGTITLNIPAGTAAGTYTGTITVATANGCVSTGMQTFAITVSQAPNVPTITPSTASICAGAIQILTAAGTTINNTYINETFSSGTAWPSGWSSSIVSGTDAAAVTTTSNAGGTANEIAFTSNNGTSTTGLERVIYGPFNSSGLTSLSLSWKNYLSHYSSSYSYYVKVQTSTDGVTWHDSGWGTNPVTASISAGTQSTSLTTDVGSSSLYISFTMGGLTFGNNYWYIDNVLLTGTITANPVWSPATALYTNAGATMGNEYTGTALGTVYSKPSSTQTYTATATIGNCSVTATSAITVNPLPQGSLSANGPFCGTGAGQLTFAATAGTGPFTIVYNDGVANRTVTGVVSGTPFSPFTSTVTSTTNYTLVSVADANCTRSTSFTGASATITVNTLPTAGITGTTSICSGTTTTLTGTGGTQYNWGSGFSVTATFTTPTLTGNATYSVIVQNAAGCTASISQLVTVNSLPTAGITGTTSICSGTTTTLTGTGGTQYNWGSGFSVTATFTTPALMTNTTYSVTVQDANNCTASISQLVTVNAIPILSSSFVSPLCNGNANGSINLSVSGLTPSITFDGTMNEAAWGSALATSSGGPAPGFTAGHEINALYATADETYSYFGIAGNVQLNNRILLFLDSKTGGYNTANFDRTNSPAGLALFNSGTTFDAGFSPDYCLVIGTNGSGTYYYDLFLLAATGSNNFLGTNGAAGLGANPVNSSNTQGFEIRIPNSALGYVGGGMKAFAAYISDGTGTLSNQFLTRANSGEGDYGSGVVSFGAAAPNPLSTPNVTYAWSNSAVTQDLANIGAGTYTVTVMTPNTCTSTASVTVTQPTALSASIVSVVHDLCLYGLGSIEIMATDGTAPYTVTRTPTQGTFTPSNMISTSGGTTNVINIPGGTTLNVTVTDANGCHVP